MSKRILVVGVWLGVAFGLVPATQGPAKAQRVVYLGCGLDADGVVTLSAAVAASGQPAVVLLEGEPSTRTHLRAFLSAYRPDRVIAVGRLREPVAALGKQLGVPGVRALPLERGPPESLWAELLPRAERVVVTPASPRGLVLRSAHLAGLMRAPLYVLRGVEGEAADLRRRLAAWGAKEVVAVGGAAALARTLPGVRLTSLAGEAEAAALADKLLTEQGPIRTLVVANPADTEGTKVGMSALAPWAALQHRAALLLTGPKGQDASALIKGALKRPETRGVEHLLLVAGLDAIPPERRQNPLPGNDESILLEPPGEADPFTLATGRVFHRDPAVAALLLARPWLIRPAGPPRVLLVSNPGGGLPLLETISRVTANDLRNAGCDAISLFRGDATAGRLRELLPEQDVFIWEGHHGTLTRFGVPSWREPLRPSLVFLQSCLALSETEATPFLERGAFGVVGSSARTYSATGGAFSLAYFNALFYEGKTAGEALRQSKNFLLLYAKLKDKRLGKGSKLGGASVRSAWAFTLWGDPTVRPPRPRPPADAQPAVRHKLTGDTLTLTVPVAKYPRARTSKYEVQAWPNARVAGLVRRGEEGEPGSLVPMLFAEVAFPGGPAGKAPRLNGGPAANRWVFAWDARRRCGYLLVLPPSDARGELRFRVVWEG